MDRDTQIAGDLRKVLRRLWDGRKILLLVMAAAAVAAGITSLVLPHKFVARATILPSVGQQSPLASQLSATAGIPTALLSIPSTPVDVFFEMLHSRAVREDVINRLGLIERYGIETENPALATKAALDHLSGQVQIARKRSGLLAVIVNVPTPHFPLLRRGVDEEARTLAAEIANAMVQSLDRVQQERGVSRARNARIYLERQLEETRSSLRAAEDSLVAFQQRHGAISVEDEARATVENLWALKAQIIAKEIEVDVLKGTRTSDSFELQRASSELEAMRRQYNELLRGSDEQEIMNSPGASASSDTKGTPASLFPEMARQALSRKREVLIQQTVYELLTQQYYQARFEESRDVPVVQVLDEAVPPPLRSSPQRRIIVILAILGGFLIGAVWVVIFRGETLRE
jgi:uncharacterized protein involved in exopolysaccharide biosynthesis